MAVTVYEATQGFPREEIYGRTAQMRRAAVSVASNFAEGQLRESTGEFIQFLGHARGSNGEVDTQIELAQRLGYLDDAQSLRLEASIEEVGRMLSALRPSLTTNH